MEKKSFSDIHTMDSIAGSNATENIHFFLEKFLGIIDRGRRLYLVSDGVGECACTKQLDRTHPGNLRVSVEKKLLPILQNHCQQNDGKIHIHELGAVGMLQAVIHLAQAVKAGCTKLEFTLSDLKFSDNLENEKGNQMWQGAFLIYILKQFGIQLNFALKGEDVDNLVSMKKLCEQYGCYESSVFVSSPPVAEVDLNIFSDAFRLPEQVAKSINFHVGIDFSPRVMLQYMQKYADTLPNGAVLAHVAQNEQEYGAETFLQKNDTQFDPLPTSGSGGVLLRQVEILNAYLDSRCHYGIALREGFFEKFSPSLLMMSIAKVTEVFLDKIMPERFGLAKPLSATPLLIYRILKDRIHYQRELIILPIQWGLAYLSKKNHTVKKVAPYAFLLHPLTVLLYDTLKNMTDNNENEPPYMQTTMAMGHIAAVFTSMLLVCLGEKAANFCFNLLAAKKKEEVKESSQSPKNLNQGDKKGKASSKAKKRQGDAHRTQRKKSAYSSACTIDEKLASILNISQLKSYIFPANEKEKIIKFLKSKTEVVQKIPAADLAVCIYASTRYERSCTNVSAFFSDNKKRLIVDMKRLENNFERLRAPKIKRP